MNYKFSFGGRDYKYEAVVAQTDGNYNPKQLKFSPVPANAFLIAGGWELYFEDGFEIYGIRDPFAAYEHHLRHCLLLVDALRGPALACLTHDALIDAFAGEFDLYTAGGELELTEDQQHWIKSLSLEPVAAMMSRDPSNPTGIGLFVDAALVEMGLYDKFAAHFNVSPVRFDMDGIFDDEEDEE